MGFNKGFIVYVLWMRTHAQTQTDTCTHTQFKCFKVNPSSRNVAVILHVNVSRHLWEQTPLSPPHCQAACDRWKHLLPILPVVYTSRGSVQWNLSFLCQHHWMGSKVKMASVEHSDSRPSRVHSHKACYIISCSLHGTLHRWHASHNNLNTDVPYLITGKEGPIT